MKFGNIDFNPANNPAVLDTATWDAAAVRQQISTVVDENCRALDEAVPNRSIPDILPGLKPFAGSQAFHDGTLSFLAGLPDGQLIFVELAEAGNVEFASPLATIALSPQRVLKTYATDADTVDRYCHNFRPDKAPQVLGPVPRLGIGVRMSAAMWPGIFKAMAEGEFAANAIQNSPRELELLENILAARPPVTIYYPGLGMVQSGHTGSTFEGLVTYGMLAALQFDGEIRYGADADHIKVARGDEGLASAKHLIDCARFYSFYTLDVADTLDYGALDVASASRAEEYLTTRIPSTQRQSVIAYHRQGTRIGGFYFRPSEAQLGRLVGKYWFALDAAESLAGYVSQSKKGRGFDLEFAIDERPPDVATCDCITTDDELAFVLLESRRRGLLLTHIAPNFGIEKGVDYRCGTGLLEFEERVRRQHLMCAEFGLLLDFHSADDLSADTRRAIGRATLGRNHFKIAPEPQMLFAATVRDLLPDLFDVWWRDAQSYALREAEAGSEFAAECLRTQDSSGKPPTITDPVFHNFGFAFVGRRDRNGQYINRERLYSLSDAFYKEYQDRLVAYLLCLAEDLFAQAAGASAATRRRSSARA